METVKNFCVSVMCSMIIVIMIVMCYTSVIGYQEKKYTNLAIQEIVSMLESENLIRTEWLNNGGDKEYLEEKIAENNKIIERFKMEITERES